MGEKLTTTYTMSSIPAWYTNYAQDILSQQQAVSARPFTPYDSTQRVAGFNPTQQQGFGMTQQAATSYQPMLNQSQQTLQGTLGRSTLGAAQPMMGQAQTALQGAANRSTVGAIQPLMGRSQNVLESTMGRSTLGAASPFINAATDTSALAPAYNSLGQAGQLAQASMNPMGISMAQPYLAAAGQSSAALGSQYMNPYIENVVNRFGELGARTLQEQLMPAIQNKYIQAGQLGGPTRAGTGASGAPSGMMTDTARALRDVQEGVLKQQQQALAEGWNQATGLASQDLGRMGQLASTAGNLGTAQQQAIAQAGQQIGQLGGQYASIGQNQQRLMADLAGQVASAYGQDTANRLAASGQLAQLAQQMGSAYGQDTANQLAVSGQYGQLGQQIASMYGQDTANQMAASGQLAQLAQQTQQQGLAGASAVTGVGNQQQALDQAYRDAQYQEFLRASGYDQAQIDNMLKAFSGVGAGVPQGQVQLQSNRGPSGSTLGSLAGAALSLAGSGAFGGGTSSTARG